MIGVPDQKGLLYVDGVYTMQVQINSQIKRLKVPLEVENSRGENIGTIKFDSNLLIQSFPKNKIMIHYIYYKL